MAGEDRQARLPDRRQGGPRPGAVPPGRPARLAALSMGAAIPAQAAQVPAPPPASNPQPPKLRVGLFVDSRLPPGGVADASARVASPVSGETRVTAGVGAAPPAEPLVWSAYSRLDRWAFAPGEDPASRVDFPAAVAHKT